MCRHFLIFVLSAFCPNLNAQMSEESISTITNQINDIRTNMIRCGNELIPSVNQIEWHRGLYKASSDYAYYMYDNSHFGHVSLAGEDAGDRLDKIGYKWRYVGENLAAGQHNFHEVLEDWLKSETHCKMLMNPHMQHFAVARYKEYWVQTFAALQVSE
jgi:uncharacterized protein YkwD